MPSMARICRAASRMALRPSSWREPEWAGRPSTVTSNRPTPLRAVTIRPPSRAGSVTSTQAALRPSSSMTARVVGLPISSSGVNRKRTGRVSAPPAAASLNACKASHAPPFMS